MKSLVMEEKELEKEQNEEADLKLFLELGINREFMEKITLAMNHITKPFDLQFGKKMRVVIDYDPQSPQVKVTFYRS
ncbi:hypothetical protein [Anaerosporobacter faecicola]|uniref:hypothetical protein n=1 Tax=Anaerosporobacter faecicola TaxID=2718714 RepID=UPI00143B3E7A|nr:hypothetical protein [Anaerosporobacter faecicola]